MGKFLFFLLGIIFAIWVYRKVKASPAYQRWYQIQYRLKRKGDQHKPY